MKNPLSKDAGVTLTLVVICLAILAAIAVYDFAPHQRDEVVRQPDKITEGLNASQPNGQCQPEKYSDWTLYDFDQKNKLEPGAIGPKLEDAGEPFYQINNVTALKAVWAVTCGSDERGPNQLAYMSMQFALSGGHTPSVTHDQWMTGVRYLMEERLLPRLSSFRCGDVPSTKTLEARRSNDSFSLVVVPRKATRVTCYAFLAFKGEKEGTEQMISLSMTGGLQALTFADGSWTKRLPE